MDLSKLKFSQSGHNNSKLSKIHPFSKKAQDPDSQGYTYRKQQRLRKVEKVFDQVEPVFASRVLMMF